jgi:hypothetical protein
MNVSMLLISVFLLLWLRLLLRLGGLISSQDSSVNPFRFSAVFFFSTHLSPTFGPYHQQRLFLKHTHTGKVAMKKIETELAETEAEMVKLRDDNAGTFVSKGENRFYW